jgi:hypothetical protein
MISELLIMVQDSKHRQPGLTITLHQTVCAVFWELIALPLPRFDP